MFDALWITLTLLQAPAPLPVTIGLPADLPTGSLPARVETARLAPPPAPPPVVAAARPATPRPRLVRGKGELSYVSTGGTAETQTIGTAAELLVTPPDWRIESKIAFLRNSVGDEVRARRLNGQFKAARKLGDRAEVFGRAAYLRNTFAGIDNSWDAAAGVTAILYQTQPQRLAIDSGFGHLTEDRTQGLGRDLTSVDFGMRHLWEFSKRNRFTNDAALKTDIERTSDWRLNHVASIQAGLNSILSLKVSHELHYRNEPVPGFTRADTVASAAIIATF
jgi:putative salt-induced outer membrane protein YdiY